MRAYTARLPENRHRHPLPDSNSRILDSENWKTLLYSDKQPATEKSAQILKMETNKDWSFYRAMGWAKRLMQIAFKKQVNLKLQVCSYTT
jgi:uncharacterized protein YydD (DUF2326 family)